MKISFEQAALAEPEVIIRGDLADPRVSELAAAVQKAVGIGAIVSTICMYCFNPDPIVKNTLKNMAAWLVASALFGLLSKICDTDALRCPH